MVAAVQAAAPRVSWAWICGIPFLLGLAVAQRFVRSGCVRGPISAAAGCLFDLRSRTAKAESLPICEVRVRISAPARAAVIFVPSLSSLIRIRGVRAQETGRQHGRWSAGRSTPIEATSILNLDQSGFWLLSPTPHLTIDGKRDRLTALESYQIFVT